MSINPPEPFGVQVLCHQSTLSSQSSRHWMQPFPLQQPPDVHSQQSRQRNPLWHLHDGPECVCERVRECVCVFSVPNEERQSLPGSLSPATRGLNSSTDGGHF